MCILLKWVPTLMAICMWLPALWLRAEDSRGVEATVRLRDGSSHELVERDSTPNNPTTQPLNHVVSPATTLGINLEGLHDYDRSFMFIDAMHTCRKFGTVKHPYGQNAEVDADGWPTGDGGTLVITDATNINGVYKFFATGRCDLSSTPNQVRNLNYNERTNRTTAEVVVNQPKDKLVTLQLVFQNTAGGLKNIKLLRPGYDSDEEIFTREFRRAIEPFGAIRFMDYLRTNNSQVKSWDERGKPTDATFAVKGGPYEYAIELGNRTGKDIYINIPALADDDHVQKLGALIRAKLKPELNCFIEYSNEVWNGQFQQYKQNFEAAKLDPSLTADGANIYQAAWRRVAKRGVEIKKIVGDDPRFKVILASQTGYDPPGTVLRHQLEYVEKYQGAPKQFFYAVAGAPYFSPGKDPDDPAKKKWLTQRDDLTIDAICDRLLQRTTNSAGDHPKAFHALARKYGLKSFAYECGLDMQQFPNSMEAKIAANYDPRMGAALEEYLNKWFEAGGDSAFYFNLSCRYGKFGYWGLTEDARNINTPKYQATLRVAKRVNGNREGEAPAEP